MSRFRAAARAHRFFAVVFGVLVGFAVAGGIAYASIPDASGVIHSCYKMDGDLRFKLIDAPAQHCESNFTALNFNQTGPRGASGAQGVHGASGASGVHGATGASGVHGVSGASGPQGASGPSGPAGAGGTLNIRTTTDTNFDLGACDTAPCESHHLVFTPCGNGESIVSGGVQIHLEDSDPFSNGGAVAVQQSYPTNDGWAVDLVSPTENGASHVDATVYAVCSS